MLAFPLINLTKNCYPIDLKKPLRATHILWVSSFTVLTLKGTDSSLIAEHDEAFF